MTPISRLERMSIAELELLRILTITQQLCKTGELETFFSILQTETERVLKDKRKQREVTAKW